MRTIPDRKTNRTGTAINTIQLHCAQPLSAFAEGTKEYYVEETEIHISLPDERIFFTRDTDKDDIYLKLFGLTYDSYMQYI